MMLLDGRQGKAKLPFILLILSKKLYVGREQETKWKRRFNPDFRSHRI